MSSSWIPGCVSADSIFFTYLCRLRFYHNEHFQKIMLTALLLISDKSLDIGKNFGLVTHWHKGQAVGGCILLDPSVTNMPCSISLNALDWSHPWEPKEREFEECLRLKQPLLHHCMLGGVGHCSRGGPPGKTGGSWAAAAACVLSQPVSNVCWPPGRVIFQHNAPPNLTFDKNLESQNFFCWENPQLKMPSAEGIWHLVTTFQNTELPVW